MNEETEYCDICKHSQLAHRLGHCMELRSTSAPEPNPAAFEKGCTCTGFIPKGTQEALCRDL